MNDHIEFAEKQLKGAEEIFGQINVDSKRRIDFTKGLAYGLIYGIVGNMFVQFSYPVIEGLTSRIFNTIFWIDIIVSVVCLLIIAFTTYQFRYQLRVDEKRVGKMNFYINAMRSYVKEIKEKEQSNK